MNLRLTLTAALSAALLIPAGASAHDGHHHRHHFRAVGLKGTASSGTPDKDPLAGRIAKASRGGNALEGDSVTVKAVKGWVADTNNDGKRSIEDVQSGDTVLVFTKRRFVDSDANRVADAFVVDKTHPARTAGTDDSRDGDGHDCDH